MWATESPTAGVGARERSTMPKGTPSRRLASVPTSWPMRVILKAVFLMRSATSVRSASSAASASAARTTPGPETPTLMTQSGSPAPWKAPAMKGLSSGGVAEDDQLGRADAVAVGGELGASAGPPGPSSRTASMLMPALVEPTLTDEQTWSVTRQRLGDGRRSAPCPRRRSPSGRGRSSRR